MSGSQRLDSRTETRGSLDGAVESARRPIRRPGLPGESDTRVRPGNKSLSLDLLFKFGFRLGRSSHGGSPFSGAGVGNLGSLASGVIFYRLICDLICPVGISANVVREPDSFFLAAFDLLAAETLHEIQYAVFNPLCRLYE
jgi:hypothetical protein